MGSFHVSKAHLPAPQPDRRIGRLHAACLSHFGHVTIGLARRRPLTLAAPRLGWGQK